MDDLFHLLDLPPNPDLIELPEEVPSSAATPLPTPPPTEPDLPIGMGGHRSTVQIAVVGPHAFYEKILMIRVDGTGAQIPDSDPGGGGIIARRVDCAGSDGHMHTLTIREIDICISDGGGGFTNMKAMVLMSEPY